MIEKEKNNKSNNLNKIDKFFFFIVGLLILISSLLAFFINKYWSFFLIFIGLNMIQYSFTNWCLLRIILKKLL